MRSAKECVSSNSSCRSLSLPKPGLFDRQIKSGESLAKTLLDAEEVPPARSTPRCEEESKTKSTNLNPYLNQGLSSRVCSNSKIVDDASIAERIQMTVDVMTRNRYINSFLNSLDQKFLDRILDDSIDIRTPFDPTLICSPAIRAIPRTIDDTQMKIGQENRTILNSEQRLLSSDAASLKVRKPDNRTRPGFRKSRKVSIAPVLVNFPDTKTGAACTCAYESSSKAMASLFEKGQDGLSSVCTYDYKTRTIQAYPLDCPPNFNELRQQGLEAIWLPMQDKAHNQAFLQAIILDDHMYQASKSLSRSDISMKPDNLGVSTPTVDVDFAQNRQKFKPPISIPISHQVDTVPLTEPHHALLMSSKENKLLQGDVSRANKDTATPGALIYGRSLETRPNGCDSRYPGAFLGIPFNTGYETEMDSISSFQSLGASSSTKADRCGPGSTYAGGESRSDSHSSFRDEVDSEAMVNFLSQLSGSSKSCDRILIDHKRDPSGARQGGHQTCLTLNSDLDPQVKRTSRESAKKIHGKATGINSATHRDATLACYSSTEHSSENSQDIDYWSLGRGMMSSSQSDPCSSSRNSRSSVTSSDEELRFDAPGFRFTAYAAELLELGRRSGSDEYYSDSTNGDKGRRLAMSRVSSGSKSTEKRKGGQASTLPISRSRVEGQNQVMSTGSRHGSSNLANHLPNIEEGNESDGHKRFARRQVKPMDTSSTNISEPPQVTISPSKKASCDTGKGVPNDNSHFEPSQLNHRSNHGGFRGPLQTAKKTIGLDASSSDLEEEPVPNERNKIAGLVEIFQTRTIISPGFKSGLERTSTLPHFIQESSYHPRAASTRIVTPSGAIYTPSGAKPGPLSNPSSIKRVPTPHSPIARPDSSLSEANTDVSSLFGERLKKFARSLSGSGKENAEEESEKYLRDSSIYG